MSPRTPTSSSEAPALTGATQRGKGRPAPQARKKAVSKAPAAEGAGNRRADIMRAAADTFYRKGYDGTTTQDIADAVGMLKGSLYYYIKAKEDLLYEIIDEVHMTLAKNLDLIAAMDGDPLPRIWALVHQNVMVNAGNLVNSGVFFRDFGALTGKRRNHILELRDKGDAVMRELIHEGQEAGAVRADVDPKIAATGINTMCNALYHWYKPEGELTPDAVARSYADLAVAGLSTSARLVTRARKAALAARERAAALSGT